MNEQLIETGKNTLPLEVERMRRLYVEYAGKAEPELLRLEAFPQAGYYFCPTKNVNTTNLHVEMGVKLPESICMTFYDPALRMMNGRRPFPLLVIDFSQRRQEKIRVDARVPVNGIRPVVQQEIKCILERVLDRAMK